MPRQVSAVTTSGTIHGNSIRPESRLRNGTLLLSSDAMTMPTMVLSTTETTVKRTVLTSAPRN